MQTTHEVVVGDARDLDCPDGSVDLVVTSPPYPMIEMWDETFAAMDPDVEAALAAGDGDRAFELMHDQLDRVWDRVVDALAPGGIACVNVGDATRTVDDEFRVYHNHARVARALSGRGLSPLPDVVWRKPANSAAKFMGSGMLPTNAYATLEHEFVLIFRKGDPRSFPPGDDRRYESAYFWEERNDWFSDVWTDLKGVGQTLDPVRVDGGEGTAAAEPDAGSGPTHDDLRDRSGAYPFELPYRLINMYSVYGDRVLDPFLGTGTTTVAAVVAGRDSIGYEIDDGFVDLLDARLDGVEDLAREVVADRLADHREFVADRRADGEDLGYENDNYGFPVRTKQERHIRFYGIDSIRADPAAEADRTYVVDHSAFEDG